VTREFSDPDFITKRQQRRLHRKAPISENPTIQPKIPDPFDLLMGRWKLFMKGSGRRRFIINKLKPELRRLGLLPQNMIPISKVDLDVSETKYAEHLLALLLYPPNYKITDRKGKTDRFRRVMAFLGGDEETLTMA
jgi:hypothetical protein